MMEGKIGIVYSPGFGAGWSTSGEDESQHGMALDQELACAIERGVPYSVLERIAQKNWPDEYLGGLKNCKVEWVEPGTPFIIEEYDGYESVRFSSDNWLIAK